MTDMETEGKETSPCTDNDTELMVPEQLGSPNA